MGLFLIALVICTYFGCALACAVLQVTYRRLAQCELLTTKIDTKMKMNYSYNEMKRAFECGRNFQLTGENNFQELIEELNQALRQPLVSGSLPLTEIIGYLERLKHYLSSGSTYCFDNEHDLNDSEELEKFINSLRQ